MVEEFDPIVAKAILISFMKKHFGDFVGLQFLKIQLEEFKIKSFKNMDKQTFEFFIDFLFKNLLRKYHSKEDVRFMKIALFAKIFGKNNAIKITSQRLYKKANRPLDFISLVFGKAEGQSILKIAKKKFNEQDIEKAKDIDQIIFMKKVFSTVFSNDPELYKEVSVDMLTYIKHGELKLNILKSLKKRFSLNSTRYSIYQEIRDKIANSDEEDLVAIFESVKTKSLSEILSDLGFVNNEKKDKNPSPSAKIDNLDDVLSEIFSNDKECKEYLEAEKKRLGEANIVFASKSKKQMFFNHLLVQPQVETLSIQRRSILFDKLKDFLGLTDSY